MIAAILLAACGGAQSGSGADYPRMIRDGKIEEALAGLERDAEARPEDASLHRLLFLAHAAAWAKATPPGERPVLDAGRRRDAEDALDAAARIEGPGVALRRALADAPRAGLVRTRTGHVALAAFALDWLTERWASRLPETPDATTKRELREGGIGLVALVADAAEAGVVDEEALRGPFDAGSSLLDAGTGGLSFGDDLLAAWPVYLAFARTAAALGASERPPPIVADALGAAILTLEKNADLALPANCDLASPIVELRRVASHDLEASRRLEAALAPAAGCVAGTYAPTR